MTAPLAGRIIWVTGSARRLGRAIALGCAAAGADVVVHCNHSREEALSACGEIRALGRRAWLLQGDLSSRETCQRLVSELQAMGVEQLHALVNNASVYPRVRFEEATEADLDAALGANLRAPFFVAQAALPLLRRTAPAHIVNIVDWAVAHPYRYYSPYMASKGGLLTLTRALAKELAPDILVNSVSPGSVLEPERLAPEVRGKILARTPLGRWGEPADIVQAVLYLLSSNYVTGSDIVVDGGRSLG